MKKMLFLVLTSLLFTSLNFAQELPVKQRQESEKPQSKFAAAHSIALDGSFDEENTPYIYTRSNSRSQILREIENQLHYTVGQFKQFYSVVSIPRTMETVRLLDRVGRKQYYTMEMAISWGYRESIPENMMVILPESGNEEWLENTFYPLYSTVRGCYSSNWDFESTSPGNIWWHFEPQRSTCYTVDLETSMATEILIKDREPGSNDGLVSFQLDLFVSPDNTTGKSPEYHRIWEDNQFNILYVFGKADYENSSRDFGHQAIRENYNQLIRNYGSFLVESSISNVDDIPILTPGVENHFRIDLKFQFPRINSFIPEREMNVTFILVDELRRASYYPEEYEVFRNHISEVMEKADLVGYDGHAGLGSNIIAFEGLGNIVADQYQIFIFNNCNTYAYQTDRLQRRHARMNGLPAARGSEYIDIIATSLASYFNHSARTNIVLINAIVRADKTYEEILADFPAVQRSVVIGEEDND